MLTQRYKLREEEKERMLEVLLNNFQIPAFYPFIPRPQPSSKLNVKFFDSSFFVEKDKLNLYQIWNEVFLFFLPSRYHSMDSMSLHNNSKDGDYWKVACRFIVSTQDHGIEYFCDLANEMYADNHAPDFEKVKPNFRADVRAICDLGGVEECLEAPSKFLLEPWVLIQLPLQPVLLHQWSVALLAESLKLQAKLTSFYITGHTKKMTQVVKKLIGFCQTMQTTAIEFFGQFTKAVMHAGYNPHQILHSFLPKMTKSLSEVLPILKFVLGPECDAVIDSLKHLAALGSGNNNLTKAVDGIEDFKMLVYSYEFWNSAKDKHFEDHSQLSQKQVEELQRFVVQEVLKGRKLSSNEEIYLKKEVSAVASELQTLKTTYLLYKETGFDCKGVPHCYQGIIFDLLRLQSEVKMSELKELILKKLAFVQINLISESPRKFYNLAKINTLLAPVTAMKKWQFAEILNKLRESTSKPDRYTLPDYNMGATRIVKYFQGRIRFLVFSMIEKQIKSLKTGPLQFYPEYFFLQYLVPSLVALLLHIDRFFWISQKKKEQFVVFLHELISSYEKTEFYQVINSTKMKGDFSYILLALGCQNRTPITIMNQPLVFFLLHVFKKDSKQPSTFEMLETGLGLLEGSLKKCEEDMFKEWKGGLPTLPRNQFALQMLAFYCRTHEVLDMEHCPFTRPICRVMRMQCLFRYARFGDSDDIKNVLPCIISHCKDMTDDASKFAEVTKHNPKISTDLVWAAIKLSPMQLLQITFYFALKDMPQKWECV